MAIADKLTHLNATKLLLRDAIRRAGHYLPDSATFRSYPYALLPDESSLSLDFVRGEYVAHNWRDGTVSRAGLSSIMTTTRASGGGYFDHLGVFQWAANNTPRIDHDPATLSTSTTSATMAAGSVTLAVTVTYQVGSYVRATYDGSNWMSGRVTASTGSSVTLWVDRVVGAGTYASWTVIRVRGLLVEESRTNLLTYSSDLSNAAWTKQGTSITSGATLAPDNSSLAGKLVEGTGAGVHRVLRNAPYAAGTVFSVYLKAGERTSCLVAIENITTGDRHLSTTAFNLAAGTVLSGTGTITPAGNGWYRCTVVAVSPSNSAPFIYLRNATGDSYTGDGTSGIYIWGAQLEAGSFPTSYIPTTTAQVTRAADQCVVSNLADWYRTDEGTLFVEASTFVPPTPGGSAAFYAALQDGVSNVMGIYRSSTPPGRTGLWVVKDGVQIVDATNGVGVPANTVTKAAMTYGATAVRTVFNGAVGPSASTAPPIPTTLNIGWRQGASRSLNGHIRSIRYFPRRLSDSELQVLTA